MRTENKSIPSITEWLSGINYKQIKRFRHEDATKRDRLELLNKVIGLPYLKAIKLNPQDITKPNALVKKLLIESKNQKFYFKLLPIDPSLAKLRIRDKNITECINWFKKQKIDPKQYKIEIIPIDKNEKMSTVFCCNSREIWGEIIEGPIWNFSRGTHKKQPTIFSYNYKTWAFSKKNTRAEQFIKQVIKKIKIKNNQQLQLLKKQIKIEVAPQNYLQGYFECIQRGENILFVDFNRRLFKILKKALTTVSNGINLLHGVCLGPGKARGNAVIINEKKVPFTQGSILVCKTASFSLLPYIKKSVGIVTEQGAILSHAAIICRELKKPYVAHVKNATQKIKNGQKIFIDADKGIIKIIKK
ncbi:MAG: PEP-utilizing enzyme [Candidatus Magasanikbacteria bacterium]